MREAAAALLLVTAHACAPAPATHSPGRPPSTASASAPIPAAPLASAPEAAETTPDSEPASPPEGSESPDDYAEETDALDDDMEELTLPAAPSAAAAPHPLDAMSDAEIESALRADAASLGSMSIGSPGAGALVNGVRIPDGDQWTLQDPGHAWGTRETIDGIVHCIESVNQRFPGTPKLHIGHVSAARGGHLLPHVSHQAGRDADLGYYYLDGSRWYTRARTGNLDRARTWALVRTFITDSDVEMILIDHSIQRLLEQQARAEGEDPAWLDSVFRGVPGSLPPLIRHARGHATHLHVRLFSPIAQESGRRLFDRLLRWGRVERPPAWRRHHVKKGETLGMLSRKYGTSIKAIMRANNLENSVIRAGRTYLVPARAPAPLRVSSRPIVIPARRLPPSLTSTPSTLGPSVNVGAHSP